MPQCLASDFKGHAQVADLPECCFDTNCGEVGCEQFEDVLDKLANTSRRVLFPGALNSEFTNTLGFLRPSQNKAISTFRILDQYGQVLDKERGVETTDEEALELYKHMVTCTASPPPSCAGCKTNGLSEHNGSDHVRGTTARETEFLHGMISLRQSSHSLTSAGLNGRGGHIRRLRQRAQPKGHHLLPIP